MAAPTNVLQRQVLAHASARAPSRKMELIDMEVQDIEITGAFSHTVQHQHKIWNRIEHFRVEPQRGRSETDESRRRHGIATREQGHVMA
jgi:hypothetical protein